MIFEYIRNTTIGILKKNEPKKLGVIIVKWLFFFRWHLRLKEVLRPFGSTGLVDPKIYFLYLNKCISLSLSTRNRLKITIDHYSFIQKKIVFNYTNQMLGQGLKFWAKSENKDFFELLLVNSAPFEEEGFIALIFKMNGFTVYTIGFSFCSGEYFGLPDEILIYISRVQGSNGNFHLISRSTKHFKENAPPAIMISSLEGIALALGIKSIVGISALNQISFNKAKKDLNKRYDLFWETFESIKIRHGDYYLQLPLKHKDIMFIKSKHRKRTSVKRKVRHDISKSVYQYMRDIVKLDPRNP